MDMDLNRPRTRRSFLDWIVGFCSVVTAVAMTIPGVMYLWPAARGDGLDNVEIEGARNLPVGGATVAKVGSQVVIVLRDRKGFKAFSAACTHLGCLVEWNSADKRFHCPCHAAVFDDNGAVVSGPPPAPLPTLKVKEIGEKVFVSAA